MQELKERFDKLLEIRDNLMKDVNAINEELSRISILILTFEKPKKLEDK